MWWIRCFDEIETQRQQRKIISRQEVSAKFQVNSSCSFVVERASYSLTLTKKGNSMNKGKYYFYFLVSALFCKFSLVVLCTHACILSHLLSLHRASSMFSRVNAHFHCLMWWDIAHVLVHSAEEIISSHSSNLKAATAVHLLRLKCVCVWVCICVSVILSFLVSPEGTLESACLSLSLFLFKVTLDNPF